MPEYTQGENLFRLTTPLGPDVLLLRRIRGTEGISELFDIGLEALAENEANVAFDQVLGQLVTVSVHSPDGSPIRFFNGLCIELEEGSRETLEAANKTFTAFRLRIAPKVWVLSLVQHLALEDVVAELDALAADIDARRPGDELRHFVLPAGTEGALDHLRTAVLATFHPCSPTAPPAPRGAPTSSSSCRCRSRCDSR